MRYLTCSELSKLIGTTSRRVQQMCKNKEIKGAIKKGRNWLIPYNDVSKYIEKMLPRKK